MPIKNTNQPATTLAAHNQLSYEQLAAAWLLGDGWEVLIPAIDHGKKTDLVIADDNKYYRIQIKTIDTNDESHMVYNQWKGSKVDYIIFFSRKADWGYIAPAFNQESRNVNSHEHIRFHAHVKPFIKAFNQL